MLINQLDNEFVALEKKLVYELKIEPDKAKRIYDAKKILTSIRFCLRLNLK